MADGFGLGSGASRPGALPGASPDGLREHDGTFSPRTVPQVDTAARVITVDRKVIEVAGHLYAEAPKNRKRRQTVYPRTAPSGYPLAERLATRVEQARTEQDSGTNPLGLIFPSPHRKHWQSSNFNRNLLKTRLPGGRLARCR